MTTEVPGIVELAETAPDGESVVEHVLNALTRDELMDLAAPQLEAILRENAR